MITLASIDGQEEFQVPREGALLSTTISQLIKANPTESKFTVRVSTPHLKSVAEYMTHHGDGKEPPVPEKPLKSKVMAEVCADAWDAAFIDNLGSDLARLYGVIVAAGKDVLNMNGLNHLGCAKIATMIKGKTAEEMKSILTGHKHDLNAEQH